LIFIGIDNGSSGGIAALREDGTVYRVDPMPPTDVEILHLFETLMAEERAVAVLEHAQAFPKMGVCSAFNYGRGYGAMQMALHAAGIPFDRVTPRKWQAAIGCLTGGDKNVSKRRAQQLFPGITVTHATADALLIAEHCRRRERGIREQESEGRAPQREGGQSRGEARRQAGGQGRP
jgi:hypothetical protein